jgi:hypothetical protein
MMIVQLNEETSQIEVRQMPIGCPVWLWKVLEERAKICHQGDLNETVNALFAMLVIDWFKEACKGAVDMTHSMN